MNQTDKKKAENRLNVILGNTNFPNLEPTEQQFREMPMSKKRFTQIKLNRGEELRMIEAVNISNWLNSLIPELKPWELYDFPVNGKAQNNE